MAKFGRLADEQRQRINEALMNVEPGSDAYDKLLKQRMEIEEIEAKRRDGRIKPCDWFKFATSVIVTGAIISADAWVPNVAGKLRIGDFVAKLVK